MSTEPLERDGARMEKSFTEYPQEVARLKEVYPDVDASDLARFFSATDYDIETAVERVSQHWEWRKKVLESAMSEEIKEELKKQKVFQLHGTDRHGHPVIWAEWSKVEGSSLFGWGTSTASIERKVKVAVALLEEAVASMAVDVHRVMLVINIEGVRVDQVDVFLIRHYITTLQSNYPERLYRVLVVPTGMLVGMFWQTISLLLNERPRHKVVFLSGGIQELTNFIDMDQIPPEHQPRPSEAVVVSEKGVHDGAGLSHVPTEMPEASS